MPTLPALIPMILLPGALILMLQQPFPAMDRRGSRAETLRARPAQTARIAPPVPGARPGKAAELTAQMVQRDTIREYVAVIPSDDGQILFNMIVAGATIFQLILLGRQSRQIQREFEATHRPKVVVRRVTYGKPSGEAGAPLMEIRVELADVGYGGAIVRECAVGVFASMTRYKAWEILEVLDGAPRERDMVIPPAGSLMLVYPVRDPGKYIELTTALAVYIAGYVVYSRPNNDERTFRLGFIRQSTAGLNAFLKVDDPDFEYADQ